MTKRAILTSTLLTLVVFSCPGLAEQQAISTQAEPVSPRQLPTEAPRTLAELTPTRITADQIARLQANPGFKAALELLEEQGEVASLSGGQVLRSRAQPAITDYSFDVTVRGSGEPGEYAKLVYSEQPGQPAIVYFDGNCTVGREPVAPQVSESARGAPCFLTPWGPWQVTGTFCGYNYWCFFKKQQALYLTERRQKTCPNGTVMTQTRTVKVHCGC